MLSEKFGVPSIFKPSPEKPKCQFDLYVEFISLKEQYANIYLNNNDILIFIFSVVSLCEIGFEISNSSEILFAICVYFDSSYFIQSMNLILCASRYFGIRSFQ
jgi:hypothetical protein